MSALYVILHIITIIAVIIFIIHTVNIHNNIYSYINELEQILKDHQVYLKKELAFRNNIENIMERCVNLLTVCNNTNLEVMSKLRKSNKDKDNKFNLLVGKLTVIQDSIKDVHKDICTIQDEAKNSYVYKMPEFALSPTKPLNTKPKTAKKWNYSKETGEYKDDK